MIGPNLANYRILRQIGSGGMGTVFAAVDPTLDREIALKVLSAEMAADPGRRARFEREAKAVAALEHPNIVTIHSVERAQTPEGEVHFLTMQLVQGGTLGELIPDSGLAVDRFFALAVPLVDALAFAHERGITHRDLKPANVMVTGDGRPMVLDFGLAKLTEPPPGSPEAETALRTRPGGGRHGGHAELTGEGRVMGTVSYMSPEQAEGKPVDHRSDIFSLGIILYQMATGRSPFSGDSPLSIMSSIVKDTPPSITELNENVPRHLARIVRKCLEKDRDRRYQSTRDLHNDLDDLRRELDSGEVLPLGDVEPSEAARVSWRAVTAGIVMTVLVGVVLWQMFGGDSRSANAPLDRWRTRQLTTLEGFQTEPSLSPDGVSFVFVDRHTAPRVGRPDSHSGNADIYMQRVDGTRAVNLTNHPAVDEQPAYSPDGTRIAFRSRRDGGGLYIMEAMGENVRRVVAGDVYMPAWAPDGDALVYSTTTFREPRSIPIDIFEIRTIDLATGDSRTVIERGLQPSWSPNGQRIAYFSLHAGNQRDIATVAVDGGEPVWITSDSALDWSPRWSPDGRFLYFSSNRGGAHNIWRVPIDEETGEAQGEPQDVTRGGTQMQGFLSIDGDGRTIVYAGMSYRANIMRLDIDPQQWTATGPPTAVTTGTREFISPHPSPDGEWLVAASRSPWQDIVLMRADGSEERKLTNDPDDDRRPRFSADGERVYFSSNREGLSNVWSIRTDGTELQQITEAGDRLGFASPDPDDRRMSVITPTGGQVFELTKPYSQQEPMEFPLYEGTHSFAPFHWSADGDRILGFLEKGRRNRMAAMFSFETGGYELVAEGVDVMLWAWLDGDRRVVGASGGQLLVHDLETGETHELLTTPVTRILLVDVSQDGRAIYFTPTSTSSDIHLVTAEEGDS